MPIKLLDFVLAHLKARRIAWTTVSREAAIPYETLKKIASGRIPNPGVHHVQRLADYFAARETSSETQVADVAAAGESAHV